MCDSALRGGPNSCKERLIGGAGVCWVGSRAVWAEADVLEKVVNAGACIAGGPTGTL